MKAPDFQYQCPDSLESALICLAREDAECRPLAGGQSLLPMMHLRLAQPEVLVDLNSVPELNFIRIHQDHVEIGAMTRYHQLEQSGAIQAEVPLFSMALPHIAHSAIRNRGTIGGSAALADPAAEMPALLLALDAIINIVSSDGARQVAAADFFLGVYETELEDNEIIRSITIPRSGPACRHGFYELARRQGDYAMVGVAVACSGLDPLTDVRVSYFSAGDCAVRAGACEAALEGVRLDDSAALDTALAAVSALEFHDDMNASASVREHLARVVLQRALQAMTAQED